MTETQCQVLEVQEFPDTQYNCTTKERRIIVIAMDDTDEADYAFDTYIRHIHKPTDRIIIVHCPDYNNTIQCNMPSNPRVIADIMKEQDNRIKALLEKLSTKLSNLGIGGTIKSVGGSPGEAIIHTTKQEKAAIVIIGSRSMGKVKRAFIGSVSDYVLHHSPVPVFICRKKTGIV